MRALYPAGCLRSSRESGPCSQWWPRQKIQNKGNKGETMYSWNIGERSEALVGTPPGGQQWVPEKTLTSVGSINSMKINLSVYSLPLLKPFILSWGTSSCPVSLLLIKACLQEGSNEMMKALPLAVNDQPGSVQGPVCRRQSLFLLPWSKKIKNKNRPRIEGICLCRGFAAERGKGNCFFVKVHVLKPRLMSAGKTGSAEAHEWTRPRVHPQRAHLQYS